MEPVNSGVWPLVKADLFNCLLPEAERLGYVDDSLEDSISPGPGVGDHGSWMVRFDWGIVGRWAAWGP